MMTAVFCLLSQHRAGNSAKEKVALGPSVVITSGHTIALKPLFSFPRANRAKYMYIILQDSKGKIGWCFAEEYTVGLSLPAIAYIVSS